jgi:hypothetical protein
MNLNKFQKAVVARYARLVFVSAIKAGAKPVEAHTDMAIALERAYARFQARNWEALQKSMNEAMLGAVRWS